jgi:hypothetical protein
MIQRISRTEHDDLPKRTDHIRPFFRRHTINYHTPMQRRGMGRPMILGHGRMWDEYGLEGGLGWRDKCGSIGEGLKLFTVSIRHQSNFAKGVMMSFGKCTYLQTLSNGGPIRLYKNKRDSVHHQDKNSTNFTFFEAS